jgi:RNA polymerase sigma-70 factor (ECF subfamily)
LVRVIMPEPDGSDVTGLLSRWQGGDAAALDRLIGLVHSELHRVAHRLMRGERADHTLQTSALIDEAYLRLIDQRRANFNNRAHFFALSAQIMRRILVDYARSRDYAKRGGRAVHVSLDDVAVVAPQSSPDLVALDEALSLLAKEDERKARVVELRYFAGLTVEEIGEILEIAPVTVMRDWTYARAWLRRTMEHGT